MKNLNLLLILPLLALFVYPAEVRSQTAAEEPPVAVVIKTPAGKIKHKKHKKIVKLPVECPTCPECPMCPPQVECPPQVICTECALTVPEALSKKDDLNIYFAVTLNKQKSVGLNKFGLDSWLTSPWSMGFMVGTEYYPTENFSLFTNYSYYGTAFANAQPGILLQQTGDTASKWDLGARYAFTRFLNAEGHVGLKQDYTLYVTTLPFATVDEFWHGLFGVTLGYHIWQNHRISFDGATGLDVYFPNTKTGYKSSTGTDINTEIKVTFKYKPEFFTSFRYEYFKLNPSNFTDQYAQYFMFGFGINFRSKVLKSDFWNRN
jgi:hypothetical protein